MPSTRHSLQRASSPHPSKTHTRAFLRKRHSFCLLACLCSQEQGRDRGRNRLQMCFILVLGWTPAGPGNQETLLHLSVQTESWDNRTSAICWQESKRWNLELLFPFPVFEWQIIWSLSVVLPLSSINFASFLSYFCKTRVNFWTKPRSVITALNKTFLLFSTRGHRVVLCGIRNWTWCSVWIPSNLENSVILWSISLLNACCSTHPL